MHKGRKKGNERCMDEEEEGHDGGPMCHSPDVSGSPCLADLVLSYRPSWPSWGGRVSPGRLSFVNIPVHVSQIRIYIVNVPLCAALSCIQLTLILSITGGRGVRARPKPEPSVQASLGPVLPP